MTELSPLPWFAFNVADYVKDTMRLSTEAHGAYLLLMLDYYATAKPCPDDDFILAAVTKLPEERWKVLRKSLEPMFDIREGHWFHNRIEREIRAASEKHAAASAQRAAASAARWGENGTEARKKVKTTPKGRVSPDRNAGRNATRIAAPPPPELREPSGSDPQTQTHTTTPFSRSSSDDDNDAKAVEEDLGSPIPPDFTLSPAQVELCVKSGADHETIQQQLRLFVAYNLDRGTWSSNWINTWSLWWERHLERVRKEAAKKAPPPRIEVNVGPTEDAIKRQLALFARGGSWSHKAFGPEPGMRGCRIDPKLIEAAGIDPKTGMKLKEPAP